MASNGSFGDVFFAVLRGKQGRAVRFIQVIWLLGHYCLLGLLRVFRDLSSRGPFSDIPLSTFEPQY
jgi:hypothetical protein